MSTTALFCLGAEILVSNTSPKDSDLTQIAFMIKHGTLLDDLCLVDVFEDDDLQDA